MKQILLALVIFAAVLVPQSHAVYPHLANLQIEIANQQTIVSNTTPVDKKLATALRSSMSKMLNAGPIDPVKASTALAAVAKTLSKSSLSNVFGPLLRGSIDSFINDLNADALDYANRLAGSVESRQRTAAEKKVDLLKAQATGADTNENVVAAAKLLSKAVKTSAVSEKLVARAEAVPPPPAQFKATITGALFGNFNFTPAPGNALADESGDMLVLLGVNVKHSNGINTITTRTLQMFIPIAEGTHIYDVASLDTNVVIIEYRVAQSSLGGPTSNEAYRATNGTVTVTMNTAARTAFGTFSFSAPAQGTSGTTASSDNGSFSVVWTQ